MNAFFSCENITVGLVWDAGTNSSETEKKGNILIY